VPINTPEFPSNWHLSIARATNTAYFLMNDLGLKQERVSVVGNSEYKPLAENDRAESRALNRRVDIVILNN
jgi:chemotaxis protein MotB